MLASVVTALVITAVWFWTLSPRADAAPLKPSPPARAVPLRACRGESCAKGRRRDHGFPLEAPAPAPVPGSQRRDPACANPDALGVSRTVVIDTQAVPVSASCNTSSSDFLTDKKSC